ncbi:MAG: type II secretion system major pseudopilin GspG [Endozoicomonas sp. (ex Botrylloides leachii)]|nr:type II secretion system major pseudopilin GspG [Endozoicomonas sp. (ex Botrylloides leachii)]
MKKTIQRGFTLIEIMVVVVILGILAAMVAPKILSRPDQAKLVIGRADIGTISRALGLYYMDNGIYPSSDQGLEALVKKPTVGPEPKNWRGYLDKVPLDPWKNPFIYDYPGEHGKYDIYSYGTKQDTDKNDAVLTSWDKEVIPNGDK